MNINNLLNPEFGSESTFTQFQNKTIAIGNVTDIESGTGTGLVTGIGIGVGNNTVVGVGNGIGIVDGVGVGNAVGNGIGQAMLRNNALTLPEHNYGVPGPGNYAHQLENYAHYQDKPGLDIALESIAQNYHMHQSSNQVNDYNAMHEPQLKSIDHSMTTQQVNTYQLSNKNSKAKVKYNRNQSPIYNMALSPYAPSYVTDRELSTNLGAGLSIQNPRLSPPVSYIDNRTRNQQSQACMKEKRSQELPAVREKRLKTDRTKKAHTRANETVQQRDLRLEKARIYKEQCKLKEFNENFLTDEAIVRLDHNLEAKPVSQTEQQYVYQSITDALKSTNLQNVVCCVCDCFTNFNNSVQLRLSQAPLEQMAAKLAFPRDTDVKFHENLRGFYDVALQCRDLSGMMLSKKGLIINDDPTKEPQLIFCKPCLTSLKNKQYKNPPKFAIANGLWIGWLPDKFTDTRRIEYAMTNRAQSSAYIKAVVGGQHKKIISHAYAFLSNPVTPCQLLPRKVDLQAEIKISICGAFTDPQKAAMLAKHKCRPGRLSGLLDYYVENNHVFSDIRRNPNIEQQADEVNIKLLRFKSLPEGNHKDKENEFSHEGRHTGEAIPVTIDTDTQETEEIIFNSTIIQEETDDQSDSECMQETPDDADYAVIRSNLIIYPNDSDYFYLTFAELIPIGRGGPNEPRPVKIALEKYLEHCMRLSHRRFQLHPTFSLIAVNILARQKSSSTIMREVVFNSDTAEIGLSITKEQFEAFTEHQQAQKQAARNNMQNPDLPQTLQPVANLIKTVNRAKTKHWGSNEERAEGRTQAFSYCNFFVSPDEENAFHELLKDVNKRHQRVAENPYACAQYFHELINIVFEHALQFSLEHQRSKSKPGIFGFTKAAYASIESQGSMNLHAHFMVWIHGMPQTVQQFNDKCTGADSEEYTSRMVACAESFVQSVPPVKTGETCFQMNDAGTRCNGELIPQPIPGHAYRKFNGKKPEFTCAKCSVCSKEYNNSQLFNDAIKYSASSAGITELTREEVDQLIVSDQPLQFPMSDNDHAANSVLASVLQLIQVHCYSHAKSCFKSSARTKAFVGLVCRFLLPFVLVLRTMISAANEIVYRTVPGGQYLNPFNTVLSCAFKCNNDVKLLIGQASANVIYYCLKYSTKDQLQIENEQQFVLAAYDKSVQNEQARTEQNPDRTSVQRYLSRLASFLSQTTKQYEMGAPMANLYLINKSPFYWSHSFANLYLNQALAYLFKQDTINVILPAKKFAAASKKKRSKSSDSDDDVDDINDPEQNVDEDVYDENILEENTPQEEQNVDDSTYQAVLQIQDYRFRNKSLASLSMHDIIRYYPKTRINRKNDNDNSLEDANQRQTRKTNTNEVYPFIAPHPQSSTHGYQKRLIPVIPIVRGARLPDIERKDLSDDKKLRYYRNIMVLHKPFRDFNHIDLNDTDNALHNWKTYFETWKASGLPQTAQNYIKFQQDYYECNNTDDHMNHSQQQVQEILENDREEYEADDDGWNDDDNDDGEDWSDIDNEFEEFANTEEIVHQLNDTLEQQSVDPQRYESLKSYDLIKSALKYVISATNKVPTEEPNKGLSHMQQFSQLRIPAVGNLTQFKKDLDKLDQSKAFVNSLPFEKPVQKLPLNVALPVRETIVLSIRECLQSNRWVEHDNSGRGIGHIREYSSIKEISTFYGLNVEQHNAFSAGALTLMKIYSQRYGLPTNVFTEMNFHVREQLLTFLCGGPGFGKSEVIKALLTFAAAWNQDGSVLTTSFTGIASQNVWGSTMHSMFSLTMNCKPRKKIQDHVRKKLAGMDLLIIDEFSFIPQHMLGGVITLLKRVYGNNNLFAGKSLMTVMDWNQQLPIKGAPMFEDPMKDTRSMNNDQLQSRIEAYNTYMAIDHGVFLKENIRIGRKFPEFAAIFERLANHTATYADFEKINAVCHRPNVDPSTGEPVEDRWVSEHQSLTPVVVSRNQEKWDINNVCVSEYAKIHGTHLVAWYAKANKGRKRECHPNEIKRMSKLRDDITGRVPILCKTQIGMPISVTQNGKSALMLSNGSIGHVVHIEHHPDNRFTESYENGVLIKMCSHMPVMVCIKLSTVHTVLVPGYPAGVVPMFPVRTRAKLKLAKFSRNYNIVQFAFIPAFAITVEKSQGQTHEQNIIMNLRTRKGVQRNALMVALTRCRDPTRTRLLQKLTMEDYLYFKPLPQIKSEIERLKNIEEQSSNRFLAQ
ncbi:hypothetical protein MIR68_007526 [Amoeboaphelidium protococcarum]|nr:hypothetical protein MIR68_007526 [Amoeboaphelidium protococcarum]